MEFYARVRAHAALPACYRFSSDIRRMDVGNLDLDSMLEIVLGKRHGPPGEVIVYHGSNP